MGGFGFFFIFWCWFFFFDNHSSFVSAPGQLERQEGPSTSPTSEQTTQARRVISKEKLILHKEYRHCLPAAPGQPSGERAGLLAACSSCGPGLHARCQAGAYQGRQLAGDSPPMHQLLPLPVDTAMGWRRAAIVLPPPLQQGDWDQVPPTYKVGIKPPTCPHPQHCTQLVGCPPAPEPPLGSPGSQQSCPKPHWQPPTPPSNHRYPPTGSSHSPVSPAATPRLGFNLWHSTCRITLPGLCPSFPKLSAPEASFTALLAVSLAPGKGRRQRRKHDEARGEGRAQSQSSTGMLKDSNCISLSQGSGPWGKAGAGETHP